MAITTRLDLRQTQSLVMTPQLQQAIKLLQLSNLELAAYVENELTQNPLLEPDEGEPGAPAESAAAPETTEVPGDPPDARDLTAAETPPTDGDSPLDLQHEDVWIDDGHTESVAAWSDGGDGPSSPMIGPGGRSDFAGPEDDPLARLGETPSLRKHLAAQLAVEIVDPIDRMIGHHLIDSLDEAGWLAAPPDAVAAALGCAADRVMAILDRLQQFDPPGIFARDLRECLALQLRDRNRLDPAMQALLDNLDLLARRDKAGLMRLCGVDAEDLAEMVAEIRALNPKPGEAFAHEIAQTTTPDILMRPHPDGGWLIELNPDNLPRVLVDTEYYARVSRAARRKEEREYINERFQAANWLVKSLHQRATTILRVSSEIVRQQDGFFLHGIEHLRPLILRDIAEAIEMHESTVSRVTTNKFIATPRGVFELKYFFTAAIAGVGGGESHSAEAVRFRIRALIEDETPAVVLSDDRIVEILKSDGIDIARRTVAKYREAMRIPSSVERRRIKSRSL